MKIDICNKIRQLRKVHGYPQEKVADLLNMSQNAYSQMESGKTKLDVEKLEHIALLYKISIHDLIDELLPPKNNRLSTLS